MRTLMPTLMPTLAMIALIGLCSEANAQAQCPELTRLRSEAVEAANTGLAVYISAPPHDMRLPVGSVEIKVLAANLAGVVSGVAHWKPAS